MSLTPSRAAPRLLVAIDRALLLGWVKGLLFAAALVAAWLWGTATAWA